MGHSELVIQPIKEMMISAHHSLTILSSISFIGSLIAPLLIGAISQAFDIRIAYMIIGILGGCIVLIVSFSSAFDIQESGDKPE